MKSDQVDVVARTMLRYLEQIDHTQETGFNRQLMSNVEKRDLLNGIDLDFTFLHAVTPAHRDFRPHPDANAAGDGSAPYTLPKTLGENHGEMVVLRRHHRAGIVRVDELPAVPIFLIDLRFPTVGLNG